MSAQAPREVALIVNPSAGGGRAARALPAVEARLRELGLPFEVDATRDLAHAGELALGAARRGRVVVTLSGDGMLGNVPGALLGVLPGGRGNDFARVVGIPLDAEAACDVIANGVPRAIDLGEAAGSPFIGIASVGFDSEANRIANQAPARLGQFVYLYGALRAVATWKPAAFTVDVDGEQVRFSGWSVGAANSKAYGGGMYAAPDAELDDGLLDVMLAAQTSRARFLGRTLPKVFKGEHVHEPSIRVLRGAEVRVAADRPFVVYADGDPVGELPMTFRALPGALRVLLPAPASTAPKGTGPLDGGTPWV
jgi:YegS/Rv2252/BmrU family lipid kinase